MEDVNYEELMRASVVAGNKAQVAYFIEQHGISVSSCDSHGTSCLILAVATNQLDIVSLLLEKGANVNESRKSGATCVFLASQGDFPGILRLLIDHKADVNLAMKDGSTPLMVAAACGNSRCCRMLLDAGATVDHQSTEGTTALFLACQNNGISCVELLLSQGASPNICRDDRVSPLYIAAQRGLSHICALLLRNGSDPQLAKGDGTTPLFKAAQNGHVETMKVLLEHKSKISNFEVINNKFQETVMHAAASSGVIGTVRVLIDRGFSVTVKNSAHKLPIDYARDLKYNDIVELLAEQAMKHGVPLNDSMEIEEPETDDVPSSGTLKSDNCSDHVLEKSGDLYNDIDNSSHQFSYFADSGTPSSNAHDLLASALNMQGSIDFADDTMRPDFRPIETLPQRDFTDRRRPLRHPASSMVSHRPRISATRPMSSGISSYSMAPYGRPPFTMPTSPPNHFHNFHGSFFHSHRPRISRGGPFPPMDRRPRYRRAGRGF